jgi:hypothetical protein
LILVHFCSIASYVQFELNPEGRLLLAKGSLNRQQQEKQREKSHMLYLFIIRGAQMAHNVSENYATPSSSLFMIG